jgi:simple sugar transport system ATP-binding protein
LLALRGITKTFPGVRALDEVDFTLQAGEVHALLGENGAGKSTLIKVLTGVYPRDAGSIELAGRALAPRSPAHAQSLGISTVYQEVNLIPNLSVAENLFLGRQPTTRWGCIRWRQINRRAAERLRRLDIDIDVTRSLNSYSIAIQQMVALARALDVDARVLILDEPTSSLDAGEVAQLFTVMRRLKQDGLGIVFITHFLEQVYAIADRITVLRNGRRVCETPARELPRLALVARMLGREVESDSPAGSRGGCVVPAPTSAAPAKREGASPLLRARHFARRGNLAPLDLDIHRGEIVGLAGLLGSGRTETARLLFAADRPDSGTLEIDGRPTRLRSPRHAIATGLGFCPEDRKREGIVPELSVRENIVLALQARRGWYRRVGRRDQQRLVDRYIAALKIATPNAHKPVGQLSGGNQQKVILARWLAADPRLLILDEPTRGIDIGAKAEIEKLVRELCADGLALLFISSELDEVVRTCNTVVVLRDRRKIGELTGAALDLDAIMRMIAAE